MIDVPVNSYQRKPISLRKRIYVAVSLLLSIGCASVRENNSAYGQDHFSPGGKWYTTDNEEAHRYIDLFLDAKDKYNCQSPSQVQELRRQLEGELKDTNNKHTTTENASVNSRLGALLIDEKKYVEAERYYRTALGLRSQTANPDKASVAVSYHNIGAVLELQKKKKDAAEMYEQSARIWESLGPKYKSDLAAELVNIGNFDFNHRQAEIALKRALKIREELYGKNSPSLLPVLLPLPTVLSEVGKTSESEIYSQRYLKLVKKSSNYAGAIYGPGAAGQSSTPKASKNN